MNRKIIQIATVSGDPREVLALCDDGTLWVKAANDTEWTQLPTIPSKAE